MFARQFVPDDANTSVVLVVVAGAGAVVVVVDVGASVVLVVLVGVLSLASTAWVSSANRRGSVVVLTGASTSESGETTSETLVVLVVGVLMVGRRVVLVSSVGGSDTKPNVPVGVAVMLRGSFLASPGSCVALARA